MKKIKDFIMPKKPQLAVILDTKRFYIWEDSRLAKVHLESFPYRSKDLCLVSSEIQDYFSDYKVNQEKTLEKRIDKMGKRGIHVSKLSSFFEDELGLVVSNSAFHRGDNCERSPFFRFHKPSPDDIFVLSYGHSTSDVGYVTVPLRPEEFELIGEIPIKFEEVISFYEAYFRGKFLEKFDYDNLMEQWRYLVTHNIILNPFYDIPIEFSSREPPINDEEMMAREVKLQKYIEDELERRSTPNTLDFKHFRG